jgi:hypothetical protein
MSSSRLFRAAAPFVPALAGAVLLAGCASGASRANGLEAKSPIQIMAAAEAAARAAASVHVAGSIVSDGKPISLNMELVSEKGGKGRVSLDGLSFRLVDVDGAVYVNGSNAFYTRFAGATAARVLRGKWLKGAQSGAMAPLASLARLRSLLNTALASHGPLARASNATIEGQQAVAVSDPVDGGTLYVAATGAPYPLEILRHGASAGKLVFDRWNQAVSLAVPTNAIDVKQLQSGR